MSAVVFGNAKAESQDHKGWFIGHFIHPAEDRRSTGDVEVKWGIHPAGEAKPTWTKAEQATTVSILIRGRFHVQFPDRDVVLSQEGDYALWAPGTFHRWTAEEDSVVLTVRWPSRPEDVVRADADTVRALEENKNSY